MPENVNTAPLTSFGATGEQNDDRPVMVQVSHVSMIFNMASEQLNSLKEYVIAIARRELMFKEFRALDDVSFEVRKGDVFGILGTNGSGKSTMLKIVAGVLEPSKGSCVINGNIAPLIELGAGFDMELTARENIYLNGALLGYPRKFISQHFDEIVEFAEIEKFLDMPMKNYSSGMVARIAFAIATIIVPEILIVDEVLSVGDFMFQQKCERRILELIKEHDVTVLIVSHNNDQIERLCNKAIWIEKGHTRMIGPAADVCRAYRVLGGHVGNPKSEELVFSMLNEDIAIPHGIIDSITGESRYNTAAKLISECDFPSEETVIIAPGELASPCMSAVGLSGIIDAPVLLSKPDGLPDATTQELRRLQPKRILLIGNEDVLSRQVENSLQAFCGTATAVERIPGSTPDAIALSIYRTGLDASPDQSWDKSAIITYDGCTGDLISFSPYIHQNHVPVFFVEQWGVIGEETSSILKSGVFDHILVLGGEAHISDSFLSECEAIGIASERVCGNGPYHANEIINDRMTSNETDHENIALDRLIVTSVWNPFDAFAAGSYAAKTHSVFLLEDPQDLDSVAHALSYIGKKQGAVKHLTFLGDDMRFSKLDKEMLAKAVVIARQS